MGDTAELSYLRLTPGPDGVSHFTTVALGFVPIGVHGVEAVLGVHRIGDTRGVLFARLPAGTTETGIRRRAASSWCACRAASR
jgi:hypothetical protein